MPASAALWFLPFAVPIALWAAWNDMRAMKIPNTAVLLLTLAFTLVGVIALPFDEYLWRWLQLVIVLVVGFLLSTAGLIGAGDAKFAAAMAPYFAMQDGLAITFLFAGILIVSFGAHRVARVTPAIRDLTPNWESWTRGDFPMGLALGSLLIVYLLLAAMGGS
ncbi:prepilin peptidase [Actibacterium sp. 188UL27-1]|uniref:prepilin peptidase n=1 Tax=Actibacterium sp. 188UL27-1 TaxID=2786961 RepID=UPI00351C878F